MGVRKWTEVLKYNSVKEDGVPGSTGVDRSPPIYIC